MYGHLIIVAMNAPSVDGVIAEKNQFLLPLLDSTKTSRYNLELLFLKCGAQTAVVGVVIFFLLTGYLSIDSIARYSKKEFMKKRIIRLFPGLFVATIVAVLIDLTLQGLTFPWHQIIAQIFMIYPIIQVAPLFGVSWTLGVEIVFYILILYFPRINFRYIITVNIIVAIISLLFHVTLSLNLSQIIYFVKFIPVILIGSAIKISENDKWNYRLTKIIIAVVLAWTNLILNRYLNGDDTTYPNIGTAIIGCGIFLSIYLLFNKKRSWDKKIPEFVKVINDNSYMIYLLQIHVGFNVMFYMKYNGITNNYILVITSVVATFFVSFICHVFFEKKAINLLKRIWSDV